MWSGNGWRRDIGGSSTKRNPQAPPWRSGSKRPWIACVVLAGSLLVSCSRWLPQPTSLPFPEPPEVHPTYQDGQVCLPEEEAAALGAWVDKVNLFRHAWERLQP